MTIIGIDPGLTGGIAVLKGSDEFSMPMPTVKAGKKSQIDETSVRKFLSTCFCARAYVEKVGGMPKQGVASVFTFGAGWGLVRGILCGLGISYELVTPQRWQKEILGGQPNSQYLVASRLWPEFDFRATNRCRKPHSGMVDAMLIAEYGRRISGERS